MSAGAPSRLARAMTWLAVGLSIAMLALGISWYGFSADVHQRFWSDIVDRLHGPMTFRFVLQPLTAVVAAVIDGLGDVRHGHTAFGGGRLREGLVSTARVVLLGLSIDAIYQFKVLDQFYPAEAVMMALLLAVVPYFIVRWIVELAARRLIRQPEERPLS